MSDKIYKKIKNYWNKQPCNINHSRKKYLSKEYFNEVRKKKYFRKEDLESSERVLEYGESPCTLLCERPVGTFTLVVRKETHRHTFFSFSLWKFLRVCF